MKSNLLPKLLTIDEVAEFFRVSKTTVYRLVGSRLIPFYKVAGRIRFDEKDLTIYLESQRVKPRDEWFYVAPHKSHPSKHK